MRGLKEGEGRETGLSSRDHKKKIMKTKSNKKQSSGLLSRPDEQRSETQTTTEQVRSQLSQFGFHWNNSRKCWQHPCGQFATEGSGQDPRQKYGSRFAADLKAA